MKAFIKSSEHVDQWRMVISKDKKKVNGGPRYNRGECFESVFLKVASAAEPGLAFLDLSIRGPVDMKHPSFWDDF